MAKEKFKPINMDKEAYLAKKLELALEQEDIVDAEFIQQASDNSAANDWFIHKTQGWVTESEDGTRLQTRLLRSPVDASFVQLIKKLVSIAIRKKVEDDFSPIDVYEAIKGLSKAFTVIIDTAYCVYITATSLSPWYRTGTTFNLERFCSAHANATCPHRQELFTCPHFRGDACALDKKKIADVLEYLVRSDVLVREGTSFSVRF